MHIRTLHTAGFLAALALGGLTAGCGAHHDAPHAAGGSGSSGAVEAAAPSEPATPSDGELDAAAKKAINDANADAEFEKLKQEIEAGGGG
ncbi:MAG: hypothetical protein EPO68_12920 [Planctomycetota bacterium]|nr:MAG: hypothetical protein EPO68_12920 [Planctomycetota bacterium]